MYNTIYTPEHAAVKLNIKTMSINNKVTKQHSLSQQIYKWSQLLLTDEIATPSP